MPGALHPWPGPQPLFLLRCPNGASRAFTAVIKTHLNPRPEVADSASPVAELDGRKRILLVEGDGFTRLVLLLRLRLAGFGVDFTSNGILGLGKLKSCHPDILLVELKLCGLSGLDLIRAARAEPGFGDRPIYVYTHADRMNRATRREVGSLATKVFDKSALTREDLVQIFATTLLNREANAPHPVNGSGTPAAPAVLSEVAVSGAVEELIAGVREQADKFSRDTGPRVASGSELLSRVSSVASCAKAATLSNLERQAKALETFLSQLCRHQQAYTDAALSTVSRAVDVMSQIPLKPSGKGQPLKRFKTVFVDEAEPSNRALEHALLEAGFDPVCFEDPARARLYLSTNYTQLVIANVVLPEGHGLAVVDLRRMSLHSRTPVLFGPESTILAPPPEDLPVSAPRLDKAPLLLAELVLRALNEVQSAGLTAPAAPTSNVSVPQAKPIQTQKPAADAVAEDGFELFAQTPAARPEPAAESHAPAQPVSPTGAAVHPPAAFNHLFTAAGIPSEPILRAVSSVPNTDQEAESAEMLPASPIEAGQVEEQQIEAFAPSSLQAEPLEPALPEANDEDQSSATTWFSTVESDSSQEITASDPVAPIEQNAAGADAESAVLELNHGQVMNNQLRVAAENTAPDENGQPGAGVPGQNSQRDLITRVCEAEMALYRAQAQIEQRDKALEDLQKQLAEAQAGQSNLAAEVPGEPSPAEQKAQARCAELEQEITALRQAFEGLNGNFAETSKPAENSQQVQELEERLSQGAAELAKQKEERQQAEEELRRELEAATAANQQSQDAHQQAQARCSELERELAQARAAGSPPSRNGSNAQPGDQNGSSICESELEQQVRQGVAALARATAELATERGERQRSQQLASDLNSRLQALHVDLSRTLQVQGEHLARISALEQQYRQTTEALDRSAADLEQQQAERHLAEEQLQKTKEANAQLRKDLSFFQDANNKFDGARQDLQSRLEANLTVAREKEARLQRENAERQRLSDSLEEARREAQNQTRRREALEQELQAAREALQDFEAKLHRESAERQRLQDAQNSAQDGLQDHTERDLEFSKLQTALQLEQVERKRQESQLARARQSALDAAHAARALRTTMRRQIREPVDNLVHSTRNLLELEMGDEQKKLAEAVLQDVLLVQTRLREPAAHAEPTEPVAPPAAAS